MHDLKGWTCTVRQFSQNGRSLSFHCTVYIWPDSWIFEFQNSKKLFLDTYPFIIFPKVCFNVIRSVLSRPLPIHINPLSLTIDKIHRLSYTSEVYSNLLKSLVQIVIPWKSMYLCVYTCHLLLDLEKMNFELVDENKIFWDFRVQFGKIRRLNYHVRWSLMDPI